MYQVSQSMIPMSDEYKTVFNKYRRRPNDPGFIGDITECIDFSNRFAEDDRILNLGFSTISTYKGAVFGLKSHKGFLYAPGALSSKLQTYLAYKAVTDFCESPNLTNIDLLPMKGHETKNHDDETIWTLWKQENGFYKVLHDCKGLTKRSKTENVGKRRFYKSMDKLSWATSGYHYDWTARSYTEQRKGEMHSILKTLGSIFAELDQVYNVKQKKKSEIPEYCAQASIVNYYNIKSSMGGHRDDLELDLSQPVISMSVGLSAVFLLGGKSKNEAPLPILIRPGDVMLLAGESRLLYHGMARVIPDFVSLPMTVCAKDYDIDEDIGEDTTIPHEEHEAVKFFLQNYRININIRQVLPKGITQIPS